MKATNPNSAWWLNCWQHSDSMVSKNLFLMCFYFWCVLLLCKLWRRKLGELVSMLGCNPSCSMKTLHELCESRFYKVHHDFTRRLVGRFLGSERMRLWEVYLLLVEKEKKKVFWWWKKIKWLDFRKTRSVCRIWIMGVVSI